MSSNLKNFKNFDLKQNLLDLENFNPQNFLAILYCTVMVFSRQIKGRANMHGQYVVKAN